MSSDQLAEMMNELLALEDRDFEPGSRWRLKIRQAPFLSEELLPGPEEVFIVERLIPSHWDRIEDRVRVRGKDGTVLTYRSGLFRYFYRHEPLTRYERLINEDPCSVED